MSIFRKKPTTTALAPTKGSKIPFFTKKRVFSALKYGIFGAISLFVVGVLAFTIFAAWISRDLPDPNTLTTREVAQSTKIYDRTGQILLYEIHGDENRTLVKINEIPDYVKNATVAIEDKAFYEHHGVYWKGLARAVYLKIFGGKRLQGASTLTQQLVKNAILTNERTFVRKVKEFVLALQIERIYSKDQILQLYLNEIPYGSTLYGIESAAKSYFGKSAKDLTLDEAALLAAIPQAPDFYSPYGTGSRGDNRLALIGRQRHILALMVEQGYVTKEEADAAREIDPLKKIKPKSLGEIKAPHFVVYVRSQLVEKYGQKQVEQGGLSVRTTLDWDKQQAAEAAVHAGVEARGKTYSFTNAGLISLDPKSGQILAMVGSNDFHDNEHGGQVNITLQPLQPGSSFKPIVYAVGFMRGYLPETQLWDVNTSFKTDSGTKTYDPRNYSKNESGPVTIRQALQRSLNIPAVKMLYMVGIGRVLDFADQLGYTTLTQRSRFGLSLVLGGGEVKPIEHASAYGAFATEGIRYPTSAILHVEDSNHAVLEDWQQPSGDQVMDPQIARLISNVLSDNDARGSTFNRTALTLPDRPVAAKTGTTNDYHAAWTVGYTPSIVTAVWVGNNNNDAMKQGADGSVIAAPIWKDYMLAATKNTPVERFTPPLPPPLDYKPALLGQVTSQMIKVDRVSGLRATDNTPPELIDLKPTYEAHDLLSYVDKDDPTGPIPINPAMDPQYNNWEAAVQDWVKRTNWHTTDTIPLLFDDVHTVDNQPHVQIVLPQKGQDLPSRSFTIQSNVAAFRGVVRVEARLNQTLVGVTSYAPWTIEARVPNNLEKGDYELSVTAIDDAGNRGQTTVSVHLSADPVVTESNSGIRITSPSSGTTWSRQVFPQNVTINVVDFNLYSKIDISFVGTDGSSRLVASIPNPTANDLQVSLPLGPEAGTYELTATGKFRDGSGEEKGKVTVQVTP